MAISAFYGLEGSPVRWRDMPLLPGLGGNFGQEYLPLHAMRWGQGDPRNVLTLSLMDVWVLPGNFNEQLGGNLVCWTPVDHDPAPPGVKRFFAESGAIPLAMSRFGQDALAEFSPLYCPHGVDTDVYRPREVPKDDIFWVMMCAANKGRPSRKGFQYAYEAFAEFHKRHPDTRLYVHSSLKAEWMQGEDLIAIQEACGIPSDAIAYADQYRLHFDPMKPEEMSHLFSTASCLLNPCTGGGFEIAQLEAAACGTPSITTDFTAMPESAGPSPWKVGGTKFWTGQRSWNLFANVSELVNALEDCYRMDDKQRRAMSRRMRRHAEKFDAKRVYEEHMRPSLRKAEKRQRRTQVSFDVTEGLQTKEPIRKPTRKTPTISIVTPWLDHPELAADYWRAVGGENVHEVIIIDNASDPPLDKGPEFIPAHLSGQVIRMEENVGFSPANNIGLEAATGEAVLFLNNDIALGLGGWLETIRSELEPGVLVAADMKTEQHAQVDGKIHQYLEGWCLAGMKEDLEALGGWDEDLEEPAYFSDNILSYEATRRGMKLVAVSPPLVHLENVTAGPPVGRVSEVTRANYQKFAAKVREGEKVPA